MKRLLQLLIASLVTVICSSAQADVIGGIDFPNIIGDFKLRSVIDNENKSPGLGFTLLYNTPGVKASVFVYNHSQHNIPDGVGSTKIHKEFSEARSNVQAAYPDAKILVREEQLLIEGIQVLHSEFEYSEMNQGSREIVLSHLYLTARKGNFVKVRVTYSAGERPELGRRIQTKFIESLFQIVAK